MPISGNSWPQNLALLADLLMTNGEFLLMFPAIGMPLKALFPSKTEAGFFRGDRLLAMKTKEPLGFLGGRGGFCSRCRRGDLLGGNPELPFVIGTPGLMKLKNSLTKVLEGVLAHDGVQPGCVVEKIRERIQFQKPIDFFVKEIGFAEILGAKALRVRSFNPGVGMDQNVVVKDR